MSTVKPREGNSLRALFERFRGARESDLFGPKGRLPRRGQPDTTRRTAMLVLAGLIVGGLALRLAIPRGLWLDEAISVHDARLSLHDLFHTLYYGDRHPPLHYLSLWATVRIFGHGELAVRLPSLIAGTLVIPVLYELGRELYDRRTGLVAAAFATVSPLLVWYSQEARMYSFFALFGLLALLTQLRVIRNGTMLNWAAYILSTAALLWSQYFGLILILVQQAIFAAVLMHRRRTGQPTKWLGIGFAYSLAILVMQLIPLAVFASNQFDSTHAAAGSPSGTYDALSFYAIVSNVAWGIWGYQPDNITQLLAALWPFLLLLSLLLLGRGGSRQTLILAAAAFTPILVLLVAAAFDRSLFEVRYFILAIPLLFLLVARLVTGWIRNPQGRMLAVGVVMATLVIGLIDQQTNEDNPRLFDFRGATDVINADAGPRSLVVFEPPDMKYVAEYYTPGIKRRPLKNGFPKRKEGRQVFVLASFQDNKLFFDRTNKAVGKLRFLATPSAAAKRRFRRVKHVKKAQTELWEFR